MVGLLWLALAIGGQEQGLKPPPAPAPVPVFEVVLRMRRGDDANADLTNTVTGVDPFQHYLVATIDANSCGMSQAGSRPANLTGTAWYVRGETLRRNGDEVTVKFEWKRAWQDGRILDNGPGGSTQLTMKIGDRVTFDAFAPGVSSRCREVRLEAGVVGRQQWQLRQGGGSGGGVSGSGGGVRETVQVGGGGGARVGPMPAAGTGPGDEQQRAQVESMLAELARVRANAAANSANGASAARAGASVGAGVGGGARSGVGGAVGPAGPPVDVELWLVDTRSDGSENAARQIIRTGGDNNTGPFRFTSAVTDQANSRSALEVTGNVQSFAGTPTRLSVRLQYRVTRGGAPGGNGTNNVSLLMPDAAEVIAIEFPFRPNSQPPVPGHHFSLRLRLAPAK